MIRLAPSEMSDREQYHLATSLVVPRPIAWVSTLSDGGVPNLAPHSYFNVISSAPLIVHFTSTGLKDSVTNCRTTGEFVVSFVSHDLATAMNVTSAKLPPEEDEFRWAGLRAVASEVVGPPRVEGAKAAMECKVVEIVSKGNGHMVFGEVVLAHVDESVMSEGRIDPTAVDAVGRMGGSWYTRATSDLFELKRPDGASMRPPADG